MYAFLIPESVYGIDVSIVIPGSSLDSLFVYVDFFSDDYFFFISSKINAKSCLWFLDNVVTNLAVIRCNIMSSSLIFSYKHEVLEVAFLTK